MKQVVKPSGGNIRRNIAAALAILLGLQILLRPAGVALAEERGDESGAPRKFLNSPTLTPVKQKKFAPDLDEMIDAARVEGRANEPQRVIIQVSEEKLQRMAAAGVALADEAAKDD